MSICYNYILFYFNGISASTTNAHSWSSIIYYFYLNILMSIDLFIVIFGCLYNNAVLYCTV